MFPWMRTLPSQPEFPIEAAPFLVIGAVSGLIVTAILLYFLITRKFAFERSAADEAGMSRA